MSVLQDFQQVWTQRFPEKPLPQSWHKHIESNLVKHKQKVAMFKDELLKEENYVEYLERLLTDIRKDDLTNVETSVSSLNEPFETLSANMCVTEISKSLSTDPFVTVIEVTGGEKAKTEPLYDLVPDEEPVNYANIDFFLHAQHDENSEEDDDVITVDTGSSDPKSNNNNNSNSLYASSSSLESSTVITERKLSTPDDDNSIFNCILTNIIDCEGNYVEWLGVLMKFMKGIQVSTQTTQPICSEVDIQTIFYRIPELYSLHAAFLDTLRSGNGIGNGFKTLALNLDLYDAYLGNYEQALETIRKCAERNTQFSTITKNIICKTLSKQSIDLSVLLHKPVVRVQKIALVLHDLVKLLPENHGDYEILTEALKITHQFLDQFNMNQTKLLFPVTDRSQRRLVKNSFIVEAVDGQRKLRHLFLFNDVITCAKYKASRRADNYTFELKWFIPVEDVVVQMDEVFTITTTTTEITSTVNNGLIQLKSQIAALRDQIGKMAPPNRRQLDRHRKYLKLLEGQLVLVAPSLQFRLKHGKNPKSSYLFYLSSEFERQQWVEAIQTLQQAGTVTSDTFFSMFELQTWITACRTFLKTNMGSYLLRTDQQDKQLLVGDLLIQICDFKSLHLDCCLEFEVDFYGHYFKKVRTKPIVDKEFVIDLEGCENLRILIYNENNSSDNGSSVLVGKCTQKLSTNWLQGTAKQFQINENYLTLQMRYNPLSNRVVPTKIGPLFRERIRDVCRREKCQIPFIIRASICEVERRGLNEVGIYRVSGSNSDIKMLKKSFQTNPYEAEQLLKEVDIHSVTCILKLYLRELPEALFTDALYPVFLHSLNECQERRMQMLNNNFEQLPDDNRHIIQFILNHLITVVRYEDENKMTLHNLATVFGPTLLRAGVQTSKNQFSNNNNNNNSSKENFALGTVDVMAQAEILYLFLQDRNHTTTNL